MKDAPKTLKEAMVYFADPQNCHDFIVKLRWPDGKVRCPHCNSDDVAYLPNAKVFKCYVKHPKQKFSLKVGTVFEDSAIGLEKWLPVMWLIVNSRNGVSSWEIRRTLGVTQKTAWFMLQRARLAMQMTARVASSRAKSRWMNPTSAAKRGTCTNRKRRRNFRALAVGWSETSRFKEYSNAAGISALV